MLDQRADELLGQVSRRDHVDVFRGLRLPSGAGHELKITPVRDRPEDRSRVGALVSVGGSFITEIKSDIDMNALYLIARHRDNHALIEAVAARAETGDRITKAEAEQMVEKAKLETTDKLRDHILELERAEAERIKAAVEPASLSG